MSPVALHFLALVIVPPKVQRNYFQGQKKAGYAAWLECEMLRQIQATAAHEGHTINFAGATDGEFSLKLTLARRTFQNCQVASNFQQWSKTLSGRQA